MVSDVGMLFGVVLPVGVNCRWFARLICSVVVLSVPEVVVVLVYGIVITTGDQPAGAVVVAAGALGFAAAQVAVEPLTAAPQL